MGIKRENNGAELLDILVSEYKMTLTEIAKVMGVIKHVPTLWKHKDTYPSDKHYEMLQNMILKLSGGNVKYKGQAFDILMNEEW